MFGNKTFIIAEIGNNHEGSYKVAKEMIIHASEAGVDAVKFQTFKVNEFLNKHHEKFNFYKKLELTQNEFFNLYEFSKKKNLYFISTPLDIPSVKFLSKFADGLKIASADIDYFPLIETIQKTRKPTILSTGMSDFKRISKAYKYFSHLNPKNFAIMHCVSSYPAEKNTLNLNCIGFLKKKFKANIGYSDHSLGIDACLSAIPLGAKVIEKHFTLDKNFSNFRDHKLSADPKELKILVDKIRYVETMLGHNSKKIQKSERKIFLGTRRFMVTKKNIRMGDRLNLDNVCWVRGKKGIKPIKNFLKQQKIIKINKQEFEQIKIKEIK